jgi:hypothetical protein
VQAKKPSLPRMENEGMSINQVENGKRIPKMPKPKFHCLVHVEHFFSLKIAIKG